MVDNDDTPALAARPPLSLVRVEVAARTDPGRKREGNEDAYLVFRTGRFIERVQSSVSEADLASRYEPAGYVMAVADGMGGAAAGEIASREALSEAFRLIVRSPKWLLTLDDPLTREADIRSFFERIRGYISGVHDALVERGSGDPTVKGMGTTLTVAYSLGLDLFVAHVGDSRAYVCRDGAMQHVTRDHTYAQRLVDSGYISEEDVETHPGRHMLTSVVGGHGGDLQGDMTHVTLKVGDAVVVCTDGLTRMMKDEEIAQVLGEAPSCEAACETLIARTLERGAPDNVTVIVARYSM